MNAKDRLRKRLEMYWKFELLNVGLVPALMFFSAFAYEYALGWGSYAAMMPMCGLLYIGGIYWRANVALWMRARRLFGGSCLSFQKRKSRSCC